MANDEIASLERQIFELTGKLNSLRKQRAEDSTSEVPNYPLETLSGSTTLLDLFGDRDKLLVIHNMGQACRYCTLWADGFNGLLPHLESMFAVVLLSKDPPAVQRRFANARGWRFRLASHGGGAYILEQTALAGQENMPGAVVYRRAGSTILRENACVFGPGDLYCSMWSLLALGGMGGGEFTPQFAYWQRPERLDDGGANVLE